MERKQSPQGFLVTHRRTAGLQDCFHPPPPYLFSCLVLSQTIYIDVQQHSLISFLVLLWASHFILACSVKASLTCRLPSSAGRLGLTRIRVFKGHEWLSAGYSCVSLPRYAGCSRNQMESVWARAHEGCGAVFHRQTGYFWVESGNK